MSKFTAEERRIIDGIVASLTIKRVSDEEIIDHIARQVNKKKITRQTLHNVRKRIKKQSYQWYTSMREGQHEYIHEFRERISEIMDLQKRHHAILDSPTEPTTVKQASMVELHKLNITLSNYFDVAPSILVGPTISSPSEAHKTEISNNKNIVV